MSSPIETEVLIVGAGPGGLAMAALLGHHGVDCVAIERRHRTNPHPRARSVNVRTGEIFRQLGALDDIEAVSLPAAWSESLIYTESLAGREIGRTEMGVQPVVAGRRVSPVPWLLSSQDQIEPILRRCAEDHDGVEVRFGTTLVDLDLDGDEVVAMVESTTGRRSIRARYLIAADGAGSTVRRRLGIAMEGPTDLATLINCHFRANLDPWTTDRPAALYWTTKPARNVFQKIDLEHRWLCQIGYDPRRDDPASFTNDKAEDWIRTSIFGPGEAADGAIGTGLDIEVIDVIPWVMSSTVAERFAQGRVFLVGDSAHQLPPSGGFGMNTAVQDAHNLAWKLAFVLRGRAEPALLDTYQLERAPVARYNADRSLENTRAVGRIRKIVETGDDPDAVAAAVTGAGRYGNWLGMDLGLYYEQGCLLADGSAPPVVDDPVSEYVDTARPGHRAPHVRLPDGRSTLDLYHREPVLVVGRDLRPDGADRLGGLPVHRLGGTGAGDADEIHSLHGLEPTGALLVRPDGHVAWRQAAHADGDQVGDALQRLGLTP